MTTTFEDRLLDELKNEVRIAAAADPAPAGRRARTPLRVAAGLTAAAAVAGGYILLPGGGATPAYAIEENPDGSVTLTMSDAEPTFDRDAQRAFAEDLEAHGVRVLIDPASEGQVCTWPDAVFAPGTLNSVGAVDLRAMDLDADEEGRPRPVRHGEDAEQSEPYISLRAGDTVVIANYSDLDLVDYRFFAGDPGDCAPVDIARFARPAE
ncbi:hypothetical protein [Streptomyces sp. RFCAC02]|uniref:hypothetical protein n=1 Tax=Streptomyces sp. RFCAC02 TaxID=2499143 RepID=UPI00102068FF|nr:hypothetical protein [Streptomyces sp. RFCAC02]